MHIEIKVDDEPPATHQSAAFSMLLSGIFLSSPYVQPNEFVGVSEQQIYRRYGQIFRRGLTTFSNLSLAEQGFLVLHLQR